MVGGLCTKREWLFVIYGISGISWRFWSSANYSITFCFHWIFNIGGWQLAAKAEDSFSTHISRFLVFMFTHISHFLVFTFVCFFPPTYFKIGSLLLTHMIEDEILVFWPLVRFHRFVAWREYCHKAGKRRNVGVEFFWILSGWCEHICNLGFKPFEVDFVKAFCAG